MNNFAHWDGKNDNSANTTCGKFKISQELLSVQPSMKPEHKCTASILGDMKHSDWIKVNFGSLHNEQNNESLTIQSQFLTKQVEFLVCVVGKKLCLLHYFAPLTKNASAFVCHRFRVRAH